MLSGVGGRELKSCLLIQNGTYEHMRSPPRISIVTPNFNNADFIEQTILSVINQGYPDLEYIVVDGASTDGSLEIIEKYKDSISCIISEQDRGHADALNKGFGRATGDILAWINSDDLYPPWSFSVVSEIFSMHKDVHWITGVPASWDEHSNLVYISPERKYINLYDYLLGKFMWIQQESVFFTRPLWEMSGAFIDEDYQLSIDTELWSRFFAHEDIWNVKTIIGGYRQHSGNRAKKYYDNVIEESYKAINKMINNIEEERIDAAQKIRKAILYKSRLARVPIPLDWARIINYIYRNELEKARHKTIRNVYGEGWVKGSVDFQI